MSHFLAVVRRTRFGLFHDSLEGTKKADDPLLYELSTMSITQTQGRSTLATSVRTQKTQADEMQSLSIANL